MENKPEYRIRVIIEDATTGEEVNQESDAVYSNDADTARTALRALDYFHKHAKMAHELVHYPKDEE